MYACREVESPATVGRHQGVTVCENTQPIRVRYLYRFEGLTPNMDYRVHSNSLQNALKAVMERVQYVKEEGVLVPPPQPQSHVFHQRLSKFRTLVCRRVGAVPPLSYQQFVEHYKGRRKQLYTQAASVASRLPFHPKEAILSSFLKVERFDFGSKPDAVPRLIQPRKPSYNARVGRYLRPLEHRLYHAIDRIFDPSGTRRTIMKGLNAQEVAAEMRTAWEEFDNPEAIFIDVSRFDQHVSKVALGWEHSVYLNSQSGAHKDELRELLRAQLETRGFVRAEGGTVQYRREGMRASGDMNTACGNVLLMCALLYAYFDGKCKYRLIDNGDDCIILGEHGEIGAATADITAWFREMGFTLKVEGRTMVFEEIRFCQTSPILTGKGWVMVRAPETLAKDMATTRNMNIKVMRDAWLTAVSDCGAALNDGVPISSKFFACIPRTVIRSRIYEVLPIDAGLFQLAKGMTNTSTAITTEARLSYARAFGIAPWEQELIENSLHGFSTVPINHPITHTLYMGLAGN